MAFVVTAVAAAFEVGATAATILTAVSEVGIACTVVGAVTGSKDLIKVGSVLGVVGGVGSLINAGISSVAESAASEALANQATQEAGTSLAEFGGTDIAENVGANAVTNTATDAAANSLTNTATNNLANGVATNTATNLTGDVAASTPTVVAQNGIPPIDSSLAGSPNYVDPTAGVTSPNAPVVADGTNGAQTTVDNVSKVGTTDYSPIQGNNPAGQAAEDYGTLDTGIKPSNDLLSTVKEKFGAAWESMGERGKSEILKSIMAVPGGIQQQKNAAAQLALQQQKVNQTSYGGQVPRFGTFGIINSAKKVG
jgi:hypothetical protein